jgi:lipoate synthase
MLVNTCIRGCDFCAVEKHNLEFIDINKLQNNQALGLSSSFISSATGDDLPDGEQKILQKLLMK